MQYMYIPVLAYTAYLSAHAEDWELSQNRMTFETFLGYLKEKVQHVFTL